MFQWSRRIGPPGGVANVRDRCAGKVQRIAESIGDDLDDMRRRRIHRDDLTPHRATIILVLSVVGIVGGMSCGLPFIVGPICWFMAQHDLAEIRAGRMDPSGEGMTRAGLILSIINTIFLVLGLAFVFFLIIASRR